MEAADIFEGCKKAGGAYEHDSYDSSCASCLNMAIVNLYSKVRMLEAMLLPSEMHVVEHRVLRKRNRKG